MLDPCYSNDLLSFLISKFASFIIHTRSLNPTLKLILSEGFELYESCGGGLHVFDFEKSNPYKMGVVINNYKKVLITHERFSIVATKINVDKL